MAFELFWGQGRILVNPWFSFALAMVVLSGGCCVEEEAGGDGDDSSDEEGALLEAVTPT